MFNYRVFDKWGHYIGSLPIPDNAVISQSRVWVDQDGLHTVIDRTEEKYKDDVVKALSRLKNAYSIRYVGN